jgi:hypothetical protein
MRPNFEVRPRAVAHLALAQGHPCVYDNMHLLNLWESFLLLCELNANPYQVETTKF